MSEAHSTAPQAAGKPAKPYPDFPLFRPRRGRQPASPAAVRSGRRRSRPSGRPWPPAPRLLYRSDLPADDGGVVRRILEALAAQFSNEGVEQAAAPLRDGRRPRRAESR